MAHIGRNDPCPCGSGKKYKKCCISEAGNVSSGPFPKPGKIKHNDDFIPVDDAMDYGQPCPDEAFFKGNNLHEHSTQKLIYSCLLNPEIEGLANKLIRGIIDRGKEELHHIQTGDMYALIEIMKNKPDQINGVALMKRLIDLKNMSVPLILQELREPQNSSFVEFAVRILHQCGTGCSNEIIEIIKTGNNRKAYAISLLCVLLGFYDHADAEKLLWDYYHYMKYKYPNEKYSDGPLLGLIEILERRKEKAPLHGFFDDDGTPINPELVPKPGLCVLCLKDDMSSEEAPCILNRFDQQGPSEFICDAFEPKNM